MADHSSDRAGRGENAEDEVVASPTSVDPFMVPAPPAAATAEADEPVADSSPRRSRPPRTDWRLGGRSVRRWRESLLAVALIALAVVLLAGVVIQWLWPSPLAAIAASALVWAGMAGVVVYALTRSRPVGLFRFRPLDILYAVVLGVTLRLVQGWIEAGESGAAHLPSAVAVDGRTGAETWLVDGVGGILVAPVVEELFFRAVIVVALYSALRRPLGRFAAGLVSVIGSAGLFVLAHAVSAPTGTSGVLSVFLLGLVCGALVALTGRIWGAVLVHLTFNATFFGLLLLGSVWG